MLWIDKYQPRRLDQLLCHADLTRTLTSLVSRAQLPHIIFYGAPGGGKQTRIMTTLQALFGDCVFKMKAESIYPEGVQTEFVCTSSLYHTQINVSELGAKDRVCVQYMIKQLVAQPPATSYTAQDASLPKYRVFVLQEAELLTTDAQAALRRTLEKFSRNARIILHCHQLSSIIPPLRSRFLCIRVPLPPHEEIIATLQNMCQKEGVSDIPRDYLESIVKLSDRNIRRAALMLQVAAMQKYPPLDQLRLPWQTLCADLVQKVLASQGLTGILIAREILYELQTNLIPSDVILLELCQKFVQSTSSVDLQYHYIRAASHYAYTIKLGTKDIWHLEAFVAQCINFSRHPQKN